MSMTTHSQVARRYAQALFGTVSPADRGAISEELQLVVVILEDPKIRETFHHPKTAKERKGELIKLMRLSPVAEDFLLLIVEKSREALIPSIALYFEELVLTAQQTTKAEITSAIPLVETTLEGLRQKLQTLTGKTVRLETKIDPAIGGGMIIKVDGKIIDASLSHTLKQVQRSLLN